VGERQYWLRPQSGKTKVAAMSKYCQLTQDERYRITALLGLGLSRSEVARRLGRSASTVCRELKRNRTHHDGSYRAAKAFQYAMARRRRCRRGPRFGTAQMQLVEALLRKKYSPEQISATLKKQGKLSISHETIYRHILADKKRGGILYKNTRIMAKLCRKRYNGHDSRGVMPGKRHISERPDAVEHRKQMGHWEGDTVIGRDKRNCVLTMVERSTGFSVVMKLRARSAEQVTKAALLVIARHCRKFKTITFDNGTEFHSYAKLEARFPVTCYFATPYHSWERGSNENFNGLFRQYVPKGTCMSTLTQRECDRIAFEINTRPRKRYGFISPKELYDRS
jgi:IS30 family transposase